MPENMSRSWIGDKSMELALDSFIVTNPGSVFFIAMRFKKVGATYEGFERCAAAYCEVIFSFSTNAAL